MIARGIELELELEQAMSRQAAVALIGPQQVGKTTLVHAVASGRPSIYLDFESSTDRAKLAVPELFLAWHQDKLRTLDPERGRQHRANQIPQLGAGGGANVG